MGEFNNKNFKDDTILIHAGRNPHKYDGIVNPPVFHASTVLASSLDDFYNFDKKRISYGIHGTETSFALESAIAALEHGAGTILCPSGLAAITTTIIACAKSGDHILITDNTYGPTRVFMNRLMAKFGVEVEYFPPMIGDNIKNMIKPNTSLIWMESPGSQTFEISDITAICKIAQDNDIITAIDNTWAAGYYYKPLDFGVDISVQAATKYISGHSDCMLGVITCNQKTLKKIRQTWDLLGQAVAPDDVYLAMRGLRTMAVRLRQHSENAVKFANWLQSRPEIIKIMHPALDTDPHHKLWQRDFTGSSGLFGFVMQDMGKKSLANMMDGLKLFGMGYSWGGFESLLIPSDPSLNRSVSKWDDNGGQTMRIHIGLEDIDDLINDFKLGLERLKT